MEFSVAMAHELYTEYFFFSHFHTIIDRCGNYSIRFIFSHFKSVEDEKYGYF